MLSSSVLAEPALLDMPVDPSIVRWTDERLVTVPSTSFFSGKPIILDWRAVTCLEYRFRDAANPLGFHQNQYTSASAPQMPSTPPKAPPTVPPIEEPPELLPEEPERQMFCGHWSQLRPVWTHSTPAGQEHTGIGSVQGRQAMPYRSEEGVRTWREVAAERGEDEVEAPGLKEGCLAAGAGGLQNCCWKENDCLRLRNEGRMARGRTGRARRWSFASRVALLHSPSGNSALRALQQEHSVGWSTGSRSPGRPTAPPSRVASFASSRPPPVPSTSKDTPAEGLLPSQKTFQASLLG